MFNTHYQPHYHPTTKSLWLCSSVYCRPPHQSRRIWLVAAATNQKGASMPLRHHIGRTNEWLPRYQSSWGQYGAHLGPVGPWWAPCWPHEPCYRGIESESTDQQHVPICLFYLHGLTLFPAWKRITSNIKCGMKLLIHSQASTVQPLKFGDW